VKIEGLEKAIRNSLIATMRLVRISDMRYNQVGMTETCSYSRKTHCERKDSIMTPKNHRRRVSGGRIPAVNAGGPRREHTGADRDL
jgi:hypothetical protein